MIFVSNDLKNVKFLAEYLTHSKLLQSLLLPSTALSALQVFIYPHIHIHTHTHTHTHTTPAPNHHSHHQRHMHFNYYLKYHLKIVYHVNSNTSHSFFEGYDTSLVAQTVKYLLTVQETWVRSLGCKDPLEKEMATHSSTLAWKIPWTEERDRLQSTGSQRVRHD